MGRGDGRRVGSWIVCHGRFFPAIYGKDSQFEITYLSAETIGISRRDLAGRFFFSVMYIYLIDADANVWRACKEGIFWKKKRQGRQTFDVAGYHYQDIH